MNNRKKLVLLTAMMTGGIMSSAANALEEGIYISPKLGYYHFENKTGVGDDVAYGLGLGYQTASPWAFELGALRVDSSDANGDVTEDQLRLNALYTLWDGNVSPYALIGVGRSSRDFATSSANRSFGELGGGINYAITDNMSWNWDLRFIHGLSDSSVEGLATVGFTYSFGGKAAPAPKQQATAAAPAIDTDLDKDGVPNFRDDCPDSERGALVNERGCYLMVASEVQINLNVNFATDSAVVDEQYFPEVEKLATFLKQYPQTNVTVEGHTDSRGSSYYNRNLSQLRANAVAKTLVDHFGIDADRVSAEGFGEDRPLVPNDSAANMAKNRRVVGVVKASVNHRAQ